MTKVEFKFDKKRDLWNYWDKSNGDNSITSFNISQKVLEICKDKTFEDCRDELSKYLSEIHNSKLIKLNLQSVQKAWKNIEREFFERMNNIMGIYEEERITAYLTTLGICPYDPNEPSFMFSFLYSLPKSLQTCGHEIMHLYFHNLYWESVESKIGNKKTWDLKEALTVILNFEFKDLWFIEDKGYEPHKKLRKFISDEWKKNKDFRILIEKCVEHLK